MLLAVSRTLRRTLPSLALSHQDYRVESISGNKQRNRVRLGVCREVLGRIVVCEI